jgi:alkylation response protein AidB-like acyl-CoA dehydrogenase
MIDFEPTEDQRLIRDTVAQLAKTAIAPRTREIEKLRAVPDDIRSAAHEMGIALASLPEAAGGQGLGLMTRVLFEEELGAADAAAAFGLPGPGALGVALAELSPERAATLMPDYAAPDAHDRFGAVAWSEAGPNKTRPGFSCVAKGEGDAWTLHGKKAFVVNAHLADRFVVFAQVDESAGWAGLGAFLVDAKDAGVKVGARHTTLGLDAVDFGDVTFDGAKGERVGPAPGEAFTKAVLRFFTKHGLAIAARAVGLSRFAFDLAREHTETRTAFGKPIAHFQAVAFNLADRHMDVESARWLVWRAASAWDNGVSEKTALLQSARAIATALEVAMRTADDCVSLHGGSGFIRDLVAEKLMRDAKQLAVSCPTSEQLDQLAAAIDLGAPLDPSLVLPTPETQPIFV